MTLANTLLNINIVLGCISMVLNLIVLGILIYRTKAGRHEGRHNR